MARHYEMTAEQFAVIEDLLPENGRPGGQWNDHRTTLNGILWVLHTDAQWRELPERYGKWKSVHDRLTRWRADGTLDRIPDRLHMRLDERGLIDHDLWCVDATSVRASRAAAGAESGGEEGARRAGGPRPGPLPWRLRHRAAPGRRRQRLAGDKGYSYRRVRRYLRRRGIKAVIPTRKDRRRNPRFDEEAYRRRNVVERCVAWLKESRRLATRHEKLAVNFLAMVKLAMIRRCFKVYDSPDRTVAGNRPGASNRLNYPPIPSRYGVRGWATINEGMTGRNSNGISINRRRAARGSSARSGRTSRRRDAAMTAPDPTHRRPDPGPVLCTDGPDLCRVRLLSREQWDALPPHERPARAAHVPGLGWVVASPVEHLN